MRHLGIENGHSTGIIEKGDTKLKVYPLKDTVWDDDALIDLLGPTF